MADVFISYESDTALNLVEEIICPAIEAAGLKCWYAKRNAGPGIYGGNIKRAIGECRVFLLILNQASLHSTHIKSETALAFRRLDNNENITLLPFRIDDCNIRDDDDMDYYLICQQIIDGCPPDEQHIQNLIDIISKIMTDPL